MPNDLLPQATFSSAGQNAANTIFGGPFEGPLTVQETNLTFLRIPRAVKLVDAVAGTTAGAAAAQGHAYLLSHGNVQNVVAVLKASDLQPGSAQRHPPKLNLPPGDWFVRAVQLSTGGAAEATILTLYFA